MSEPTLRRLICKCPHTLTCADVNVPCEQHPGREHWPILNDEQWRQSIPEQRVTEEAYPHGVRCGNCKREIKAGQLYKLRSLVTGRLSTGPCTEDRGDGVFCADC
jgi:hypothetical protein